MQYTLGPYTKRTNVRHGMFSLEGGTYSYLLRSKNDATCEMIALK